MISEEVYHAWKRQKSQVEASEDFSGKVMSRIHNYQQQKTKPLFDLQRFAALISAHPLAKASLIAAGALAGVLRVIFAIHLLLFGS